MPHRHSLLDLDQRSNHLVCTYGWGRCRSKAEDAGSRVWSVEPPIRLFHPPAVRHRPARQRTGGQLSCFRKFDPSKRKVRWIDHAGLEPSSSMDQAARRNSVSACCTGTGPARSRQQQHRDRDGDRRDERQRLDARQRHMVRRLYVDGPAAGFVSPAPPVVNVRPAGPARPRCCRAFVCLVRKWSALRASAINLRIVPCPL